VLRRKKTTLDVLMKGKNSSVWIPVGTDLLPALKGEAFKRKK
jgi:hypothetical protein